MIKIRSALASDLPFIFSTWLKSFKGDSTFAKRIKSDTFFSEHHRLIEAALARPGTTTFIAHMENEPEVILGYLVHERVYKDPADVVHYVFVKQSCRRHGVAASLLGHIKVDMFSITHLTFSVMDLIKDRANIIYNPYLF